MSYNDLKHEVLYSQRSEDVRSCLIPVDNDGVLDRFKFISKGDEHQVYGKPILDILVTNDIQNSETYKTFIDLSTGSIPPKKGRGKGTQGTKTTIIPKKATTASKNKRAKKIESSDEDLEEQEERLIRRKPRGVVIQDTSQVSKKKSIDYGSSKGVGITPEVLDEPTGKYAVSDEGAGTSREVLMRERTKVSTDEDESDDDEEYDESIDIETTNDKKTDTDVEDQFLNSHNVSLIGTIQENAKVEINSLLDIQIQQDVPNIQQEPFHVVKVSVIPEPTQIPPSTPPTPLLLATITPAVQVPNFEAFTTILPRVSDLEKDVKELKQVDHTPAILELIKFEVPEAVNKYLGSTLGDALQKVLQRHTEELRQEFTQKTIIQTHTEDLNVQVSQDDVSKFIKVKQELAAKEKMLKY
ncbi:hypothetical protein Tco_0097103 [Tanacetum coccineum]